MAKILVVDDCEEFRESVADFLIGEGYQVTLAADAEEAFAHCDSQLFDAVLCDLALPLEEGADAEDSASAMVGVHAIFSLSRRFPKLPIIAISGELTGEPLSAILRFGAASCLSKPFRCSELLRALEDGLQRKAELN